jgi:4-hydroxybenzoate polyprenyltransferase
MPDASRHNRRMATEAAARSRFSLYLDLIRWDRPAGTYLLLWPTLSALWIAAGGFPGWHSSSSSCSAPS